ncbi:MAG TPA: hypothetical protein VGH40_09130 [Roseiarcus sp.]|jgi:hypothetical protein
MTRQSIERSVIAPSPVMFASMERAERHSTGAPVACPAPEPDFSAAARILLGLLFVALICLRLPNVVWSGRFYAEEGEFFFAYAWHMPWERALWHPLGGYLNLVASASTLLAKVLVEKAWVPLEDAPYVTEAVALFFQTCPAILILSSRASWLRPRWALIAALAVLATPPLAEQVWLHTLHSQFHLALCAAVILATDAEAGLALALFRICLLILGPLCGPASIVMLPFFVARAILEGARARWLQTSALALGSALQLSLFYSASGARSYHIDADVLACVMFVRHLMLPFLGPVLAMRYGHDIRVMVGAGGMPWAIVALSVILFGGLAIVSLRRWREAPAWLLIPGLVLAAVSYFGAIRAGPALLTVEFATRYAFVPQVLIGFALLAFATSRRGRLSKICAVATAWIVAVGVVSYFQPLSSLAEGPDWRSEVAAWRADPEHRLAAWPKGWLVDLAPTKAQCSPDPKAADQPDFCDQYWEKL